MLNSLKMIDTFFVNFRWLLIGMIIFAFYKYMTRNLNYWSKRNVLGPKPIPIVGTMYYYFTRSMPAVELDWYKKYGKVFGLYNGNKPVISVAEPELVKQILVKNFNEFRNRRSNTTIIHPIAIKSMFSSRDDDWKRIRAIASPAFTSGKLKKMYSLINECSDDFMDNLNGYAISNSEIEVKTLYAAYTMDVIAKCAFATNTNTHKDPNNEFSKNASELVNLKTWKFIVAALLPSFIINNSEVMKLLNIMYYSSDFFIEAGRKIINRRKNRGEKHNDFLQLLIDVERNDDVFNQTDSMAMNHLNEGKDEMNANTKALSNVIEKKLTEDEILAQCWIFFIAGFETTSSTLAFSSYEMALQSEVQEKLYEEVKTAFGDKGEVDYETLLKLPYLDAVISETLRKYPPLLRLERQAMDDVVLGDTGITIPKGMVAEIPIYGIHYDPENYENPSSFNPERFMPANRSNIKPYTYLPFGTGPRNCVGMRFALLEAKLALVNIIRRFIFFKTTKTDVPLILKKGRAGGVRPTRNIIIGIKKRY